jgi:hypothetical protein
MGDFHPQDTNYYSRIFANDHAVPRAIRRGIGGHLREMYSHLLQERLPPKITEL